jgi:hypothetical protein
MTGIYTHAGIKKEVTYRVYLGENMVDNFDILANKSYTLYMTIRGYSETDAHVFQLVTDLSQNQSGVLETANSYIVRDGGKSYKFNATIMGNGKRTPAATIISPSNIIQNAPAIMPAPLSPANALVLWETGSKGSVIEDGSVTLGVDGYVRFKTANNTTNGNAVIAVRDAANNILWSWHIWKVPYNPNSDYDVYNTLGGRSFKMMKYNLGATAISPWNAAATNAGDMGLFYQWGRKDPFAGVSGWGSVLIPVTYANGYSRSIVSTTQAGVDGTASIAYSIKNPNHFISYNNANTTRDWVNASSFAGQMDNLWGNPNLNLPQSNSSLGSKSIYDPCPPGWRVPPSDSYTIFTQTGDNNSTDINVSGSFSKGFIFYTQSYKANTTSYWPALGFLEGDGSVKRVTSEGRYWSSYITSLGFIAGVVSPKYFYDRASGLSVRCAQE